MNEALTKLADNWDAQAKQSESEGWPAEGAAWSSAAAELRAALASAPAAELGDPVRQAFIRGWDERGKAHEMRGSETTDRFMRQLMDVYYPRNTQDTAPARADVPPGYFQAIYEALPTLPRLPEDDETAQPAAGAVSDEAKFDAAFDKVDHYLRANLNDSDYAEYADALQLIYEAPPTSQPAPQQGEAMRSMARRLLWLAFSWNDHNFDAAHTEARKEAARHGITSLDEANAWLENPAQPAEQAGEDAARLDWVIRQGDEFRCFIITDAAGDGDYCAWGYGINACGRGKTGREAIDAARAAQAVRYGGSHGK